MMSRYTSVSCVLLAALMLAAAGQAPAGVPAEAPVAEEAAKALDAEASAEAPADDTSAETLLAQVEKEAAKGRLTGPLLDLYRDYTSARFREAHVPDRLAEPFWEWLLEREDLRDAVLFGMEPEREADLRVLDRLAALRKAFPEQVEAYPHLAFAFAVVYGRAGGRSIREPHLRFVAKGRKVPSMADSFQDYVAHAGEMKMPLNRTLWPLLIHVADNDLPLQERDWVRRRYGSTPIGKLGHIYYDLEYDDDTRRGHAKIGDRPKTMPNLLTYGGVCADRAYFASRVAKTFGVPAMYDVGAGERGGHAWLAHLGPRPGRKKGMDLLFTGRFDYDRYYTGTVYDPGTGKHILDREVQLKVAAMMQSYWGHLEALAACRLYRLHEGEARGKVTGLLEAAVKRNPYCDAPWRLVAADVAEGYIPRRKGEKMYQSMLRQFGAYPDLTFRVLEKILEPRLAEAARADTREISKNLTILGKAFDVYARARRPDLAVRLRCLQGEYLEAAGHEENALKGYVTASERYLTEHFGFLDLYKRACRIMKASGQQELMLKYMDRVVRRVPEFKSDRNRMFGEVNPTYTIVVQSYANALRKAGRTAKADRLMERLQMLRNKKG